MTEILNNQTDNNDEEDDDLQNRRSNRKRRRINYYKPVDKKQKINKLSKKRRQPKIQAAVKRADKTTQSSQTHKGFCSELDIDTAVNSLIESADKDKIQDIINRLTQWLHNSHHTLNSDKADDTISCNTKNVAQNSAAVEDRSSVIDNSCLLKAATSMPANLQAKSVSVHGNSVIIDGVINTGLAQTSCYLIPIDINNIPGSMQLVGSSGVNNRRDDTITTSNQLYSMPPPNIYGVGTGTNIGGVQILGNTSAHIGGQNAPMLIPLNRFAQYPQVINIPQCSTTFVGPATTTVPQCSTTFMGPATTTVSTSTLSLENVIPEPTKPPSVTLTDTLTNNVPVFAESIPIIDLDIPEGHSNGLAAPKEPSEQNKEAVVLAEEMKTRIDHPSTQDVGGKDQNQSGKPATSDTAIDNMIDALQSTESLTQILDQLSYDEMLAIVNILASPPENAESAAEGSDTSATSLPAYGSSEATDEVAVEGFVAHDEDEDFKHVVMMEQKADAAETGEKITCVLCGKVCTDNKSFVNHMRYHIFNHRYSCYECGFGTSSMNELLMHKSNNHEGDLNKISPEFLQRLPKRERVVSTEEEDNTPILCPECNIEIPLHALGRHMGQAHKPLNKTTPGRKPKCSVCTARVDNKVELAAHVAHHSQEEHSFVCYFCPGSFASVSLLQIHTAAEHAVLASKRVYKCTHCCREFSGSYHLIRHVKTVHEQRRDYKCSKCDKSFVELHCLRRHIRNIHSLIRDHTCPVCHRGFTYRQDMFRHIMSVHQKIRDIKCPLCGDKFYHRYFIGHATRAHDLRVKYRDGICYIYDDSGNVIHKIT